jgi:hypothetical protein
MSKQEKSTDTLPVKVVKEKRQRKKTQIKQSSQQSQEQQLQELKLSWAGKLFFAGAAAYIGASAYKGIKAAKTPKLPFKVKGTKREIKAIMDAIAGSAEFQRMTSRPGANIEQIIDQLKQKNMNKQNFERIFKVKWPL